MAGKEFDNVLPAIWLVFGGSYLNHSNAPCLAEDKREQSLVDLLRFYLKSELVCVNAEQRFDGPTLIQLATVTNLLKTWSEDLNIFYEIRKAGNNCDFEIRQMARRLLLRVKTFENCTIIPNGLMTAKHSNDILKLFSGCHDHVNLAILKRNDDCVDWVQVDPGSAYHQRCKDLDGEKSDTYLEIAEINPNDITEDWLCLLVGLKAVDLNDEMYYQEISLYECLLAHLNGKTAFKSQPDEGFIVYSHTSPVHTWQVIDQSFRYLLQTFLGDTYCTVYRRLLTGFKFFLLEITFAAYQLKDTMHARQCHFLLQEMCHDVSYHALIQGNEGQKQYALMIIDRVKAAIEQKCSRLELQECHKSQLSEARVLSLSFVAPHLTDHTHTSENSTSSSLKAQPVFLKPNVDGDLIDYLQLLKLTFINELKDSKFLDDISLLSYGIECFLIDHLSSTDIFEKSLYSPFSKNDELLGEILIEFAEIYHDCQIQLVNDFLSNGTYQPQFYAKNVIIQFFVYAAVAALNYRDQKIGSLLSTRNLSVAISDSLSLHKIIPRLVIEDANWLKVLLSLKSFFTPQKGTQDNRLPFEKYYLFSYKKFIGPRITFEITNTADEDDTDVAFAYQLLKKYETALNNFECNYRGLEDEKLNRKWQALAYSDTYLPSLYILLSKVAHFAKVSLTGLSSSNNGVSDQMKWDFNNRSFTTGSFWTNNFKRHYKSEVSLEINSRTGISTMPSSKQLWSFILKPSSSDGVKFHQRLIFWQEEPNELSNHFLENEIIASQDMRPPTMDRSRYFQLGCLQSVAQLKIERLYIALKDLRIDFSCEQESVLIKQTLFEVSELVHTDERICTLLEWTVHRNPSLIHELGMMCVEKARLMEHRLTQYHAIGEILEVILGLLTFYPSANIDEFIEGIVDIYHLLKVVLAQPPSHLCDVTLLHLNAYLLIIVQAKPRLIETETLTTLKALLAIQNYKAKGTKLDNNLSLRVQVASFTWCSWIERELTQNLSLLNILMLSIIPQWDQASSWQKSEEGLLFTCGDYAIKPLQGGIYFQNQPIRGLPDTITEHRDFKKYLGEVNFTVIPSSRTIQTQEVPCFLSVDITPQTRLTLIETILMIEECIEGSFQRYIPVEELSSHKNYEYPNFLYQSPNNEEEFTHWLDENRRILVKDQQRQIIYQWNLENNHLFSLQHQGYVVPWDQLESSVFKTWLERVEKSGWIEIIAQKTSENSAVLIKSLNFPRLGLNFDFRGYEFFSRQVHGYILAENQQLNTLHGFSNYLVLIKKERDFTTQSLKVIIPHRIVKPDGYFYSKKTIVSLESVQCSTYIIYDVDPMIGILKCQSIHAHLYLALLYFCSASLDDHDLSNCDAYHLARENLEASWKPEPFNELELNIIEQFLSPSTMRDFHCHRIALYLKVVSLLCSSLRLKFLYTGKSARQSKERSDELLEKCEQHLPHLLRIYLQNQTSIFTRIRLSLEEKENLIKLCSTSFQAYHQLTLDQNLKIPLPTETRKSYKHSYSELFSKDALNGTSFFTIFNKYINLFSVSYDEKGINFTSGIKGILIERFRLNHFIPLYNLAKSSAVNSVNFRYLLHHLVIRARTNYEIFPAELVLMLARVLLLVAENPTLYPDSPPWFGLGKNSVELFKRRLSKSMMLHRFPDFYWSPSQTYASCYELGDAKRRAEVINDQENEQIWSKFQSDHLDSKGILLRSPESPRESFSLPYCYNIPCNDTKKREALRDLYSETAYNDGMYQFFINIVQVCDEQKCFSSMGWSIAPFIDNPITITISTPDKSTPLVLEPINLEKWAISSQPIIDLDEFFVINEGGAQRGDFIFESQLKEPANGYQGQLYYELKDSWSAFQTKLEVNYSCLDSQSINKLKCTLKTEHGKTCRLRKHYWDFISKQFKQRPNSESDNYFALRWYSGLVRHYHKRDLLKLLVEPHKLASYNPDCLQKQDSVIQKLLEYVCCEINAAKIVRVLILIEQYKKANNEEEQFSILQGLVRSIQENLDPMSFRYPYWLLFQLENEIVVRDNQRELIVAMLNQTEKAMYQLNMGEGKSSVILPLLCNNLANGQQLLRVNVLTALLNTTKEFLRTRFSGLIRKRVYTLPFYRDTDVSTQNLTLILQTLQTCQRDQHILLVTPEHRLCLQLKIREFMLENQQQIGATNIFNWDAYRQRVQKIEVYQDLSETEMEQHLAKQDEHLRACLLDERYIDSDNIILKVPPRGQGRKEFARFRDTINDSTFREWSCLKAAYRELLYNSTFAHADSSEILVILYSINALAAIDLLDESDEILRHGTELNYTMGDKHAFAGGQLRWQIPQFFIKAIFCDPKVKNILTEGKSNGFTTYNTYYSKKGGVSFIQLLSESYYNECIKPLLIDLFFLENLPTLRKYNANADTDSLRNYVSGNLSLSEEKKVMAFIDDKGSVKVKLLIAKGWLSHGILFHVFNAKYRVQFGLNHHVQDQLPKPIAIPFTGKDAVAPRSEFSHPDVMLGFTIISYLYQGLTLQQTKEILRKLSTMYSDQVADNKLRMWAEASRAWIEPQVESFPPLMLTSLKNLDLSDEQCLNKVHHYLSGNHLAIFFYLNEFILIQEAMQYLYKISANAHCLVGYNAALGFSGTDDRKLTMPFQIKSLRSTSQEGTNGKLLSVLTQERNSHYYSIPVEDTNTLLEEFCLYVAEHSHCHALIDAGALVTGLTNYEVAKFLLAKFPSRFSGILYFSDEGNCLTVLTRDNKSTLLQDCYLDKRCLFAYLDDTHTRGTDIKLPLNCHAILTVGMGMQKDKLMQAAMRLRQLAQKQSVSLWGTQVVTLAIARDNSVDAAVINSSEIIKWVTRNTIDHIKADLFSVAVRKMNFQFLKKAEAWLKQAPTTLDSLLKHCQEKELYSLEEFYGLSPQRQDLADRLYCLAAERIRTFWQEIDQELRSKQLTCTAFYESIFDQSDKNFFREGLDTICKEVAVYLQVGFVHSSLEDDQEKEVEVEIIQEKEVVIEVEKRDAYSEEMWDIRLILKEDFISLAERKNIIMPLKAIKHFVRIPPNLKNIIWHANIYMTNNFMLSIKSKPNEVFDNYLRPVDMVLIHRLLEETRVVLVSGQEASNIKSTCYPVRDNIILVHLSDIDGPTQLPKGSALSKKEQKLLTIIKLFSGECNYSSSNETFRLAKRVGRLYPHYFTNLDKAIDRDCSVKIFDLLIEKGYLDYSGTLTKKLAKVLNQMKSEESSMLDLPSQYLQHTSHLLKKLHGIHTKLIIQPTDNLRDSHYILWQWISTRGRLKEYIGSVLETILNPEYSIKGSI